MRNARLNTSLFGVILFVLFTANSVSAAWIDIWESYVENSPYIEMMVYGEDNSGGTIDENYSTPPDLYEMVEFWTPYDDGLTPTATSKRWQTSSNSLMGDTATIEMHGLDEFNAPEDPSPLYNGHIGISSMLMGSSYGEYGLTVFSDSGNTGQVDVTFNLNEFILPFNGMFDFNISLFDSDYNEILALASYNGLLNETLSLNFDEYYYLSVQFMMDSFLFADYFDGTPFDYDFLYSMEEAWVDLEISVGEESPVPIPSAGILLFAGLLGLAGYKRKKL